MADQEKERSSGEEMADKSAPAKSPPRKKPKKSPPRQLPPWRVMLHNDDKNEFEDVVKTIRKLTTLSKEEAVLRTIEAHNTGVALLLVTHQERAELYVEQFTSCGLTATTEPAT